MKSGDYLLIGLFAFFFLPGFIYSMRLALGGKDPD